MVLGLQGYTQLAKFKSADILGYMVAASLLRELGPVLAAILFASSAGGAMTSEIGLMKTTEQLEAMGMMAVDPVSRVVVPRFWAGVLSMPLLASVFNVCGIAGAYLIGVEWLGLDSVVFWSQRQNNIALGYDCRLPRFSLRAYRRRHPAGKHPHRRRLRPVRAGFGFCINRIYVCRISR